MTQRHEDIERVMEELERYGLRGEVGERGKHLEVRWDTPQGQRFVIVARTPSDWRSGLNTRSEVRKLLRADNLQPKTISALSFQKAMSLPKPQLINRELALQNDVDALTDMVIEQGSALANLQMQITALQDKLSSITVVSQIRFAGQQKSEDGDVVLQVERKLFEEIAQPAGPFRAGSTQAKIYNVLTEQFMHIHDIQKLCGVGLKYINTTMWQAKQRGLVEPGLRGMYRRKP